MFFFLAPERKFWRQDLNLSWPDSWIILILLPGVSWELSRNGPHDSWRDRVLTHSPVYLQDCSSEKVHGLASTRVQDWGSVAPGKFSGEIVAKETSVLTQSFFGSSTGHDARRSSHAHPEDSFQKSTSPFVQVRPIHNLVFFRYSCTCKMLTQTFLCLLRNNISRSFTEMFLAIFQHARPEDSFTKSTSPFVQVRPIHNLVRFRCSCTCKKLMQTFLCLLRDTISRSFT